MAIANSTIAVYGRAGGVPTTDDLNTFLSIDTSHSSTDPRIVYDAASARWWLTDTEAPKSPAAAFAAPVLVAVSASSNPLPFSSWIVYTLPFETAGTILGDQPGLGMSSNVAAVTWNDYDCNGNWLGSELDILQKSDLEHNTGTHGDSPWTSGNAFAPQPVQSFGAITTQYVVTNESDCAPNVCATARGRGGCVHRDTRSSERGSRSVEPGHDADARDGEWQPGVHTAGAAARYEHDNSDR